MHFAIFPQIKYNYSTFFGIQKTFFKFLMCGLTLVCGFWGQVTQKNKLNCQKEKKKQ